MRILSIALIFSLALVAPALAMEGMEHGGMSHGKTGMADQAGDRIREGKAADFTLTYTLLMLENAVEGNDHHLMVFIAGKDGKALTGAKVGFEITPPAGNPQRVMAMGMMMSGRVEYGANVALPAKGSYKIRCKVATPGGKTFSDEFTFQVK